MKGLELSRQFYESYGKEMLEAGKFLMELKCPGAIPLWMTEILSEERIYKTSFSKYGTAYCCFMKDTPEERARSIAAAAGIDAAAGRTVPHSTRRYGRVQKETAAFGRISA